MNAHPVERPHVEFQQRIALTLGQVVAIGERGRRFEIGLAALRPAVYVADQLLQRIETHNPDVRIFSAAILAVAPVDRKLHSRERCAADARARGARKASSRIQARKNRAVDAAASAPPTIITR